MERASEATPGEPHATGSCARRASMTSGSSCLRNERLLTPCHVICSEVNRSVDTERSTCRLAHLILYKEIIEETQLIANIYTVVVKH